MPDVNNDPSVPEDDGRMPARERIWLRHRPSDLAGRRIDNVVPATIHSDEQAREGRVL